MSVNNKLGAIFVGAALLYVVYRGYKKRNLPEPFVIEDEVKTSNASGWPTASSAAKQVACYGGGPPSRPTCSKGQCI